MVPSSICQNRFCCKVTGLLYKQCKVWPFNKDERIVLFLPFRQFYKKPQKLIYHLVPIFKRNELLLKNTAVNITKLLKVWHCAPSNIKFQTITPVCLLVCLRNKVLEGNNKNKKNPAYSSLSNSVDTFFLLWSCWPFLR